MPLHHIFGSEALSARSPPVAERAPTPYAALHPDDLRALGSPSLVIVPLGDGRFLRLPAREDATLRRGALGIPVGLPELPLGEWPDWTTPRGEGGGP